MKCKNCGNTLYFDSERKLLYCPVCGYEEKPPDLCPRCKSPNIYYFGGGIQKLIPEIKSTFRNANILKMVSSKYMKRAIVNSREFTSTIFVGTEFLLSHLNADNVFLFGFISIDTFIENYGHESGVNAFTIVQDAASEIKGKEIIIQTYTPENYVVNAIKNLDFKNFLDQELYLRKSLNYPPFFSLVILSFQNTQNEKVKSTKEYLEKALLNKAQVLGPSNGKEPNTFEITIKVLGATPAQMMEALKSASMKSKVDFNLRVYPTFTYFSSENRA
jgi:primosomal protein N' (replication factor Y)